MSLSIAVHRLMRFTGVATFVLLSVAAACSSDGGSSGSSGALTLENICDVLPQKYCAQDHPCCIKAGFGFDEEACELGYRRYCAAGVAAVVQHTAVFHPEKLEPCIAGYQPIEDKCSVTAVDYEAGQKITACAEIFEGKAAVGEPCDTSQDCAPPKSGALVYCDVTCMTLDAAAQEGDDCSTASCDALLDCDSTNHCVPAAGPNYIVNEENCSNTTTTVTVGDGGP